MILIVCVIAWSNIRPNTKSNVRLVPGFWQLTLFRVISSFSAKTFDQKYYPMSVHISDQKCVCFNFLYFFWRDQILLNRLFVIQRTKYPLPILKTWINMLHQSLARLLLFLLIFLSELLNISPVFSCWLICNNLHFFIHFYGQSSFYVPIIIYYRGCPLLLFPLFPTNPQNSLKK